MTFTKPQLDRYARHIILPNVGPQGQQKLLDSKVLVLGAGGLGSPILLYLAAAGVGTIGIEHGCGGECRLCGFGRGGLCGRCVRSACLKQED